MAIGIWLDKYLNKAESGGGSSLPAVTSEDNGDVLTVVEGAWDKASPSGGGGNFVVTFTTEDYSTVTVDKTYAEIISAFNSGANVVGYLDLTALDSGISVVPLGNVIEDSTYGMITFQSIITSGSGGSIASITAMILTVLVDDTAGISMNSRTFS